MGLISPALQPPGYLVGPPTATQALSANTTEQFNFDFLDYRCPLAW